MSDDYFDPHEAPKPEGRLCEVDGDNIDTYGGEHYWQCGWPGVITVNGTLMCVDHAGECGYGPKREEYGYELGVLGEGNLGIWTDWPGPVSPLETER